MVPQEVVDLGQDRHLVLLWVRGRGRQSGVELEGDIGHIATLREGRIAQIDTYLGWDEAREAAAAARERR